MMNYRHQEVEAKWQKRWEEEGVFVVRNLTPSPSDRSHHPVPRRVSGHPSSLGPPFGGASPPAGRAGRRGENVYVLDMFPYPSSDGLHVGHPEGYTATDIVSRYLRMKGKNVLHPMGWDAFGLPAENAAIKKVVHPRVVTEQNVKNFKRQIQSLGFSYDWSREINTTDPAYYKWTQWIFLQLFKKGLAYEAELPIWWCPKDKTGLANEEVVNGCCERCGTKVGKKLIRQWLLRITAYAERLIEGLVNLDWPESIKALQQNWIGRSEGAEVEFEIETPKQVRGDIGKRRVLIGTRNAAKIEMVRKALEGATGLELISLNDLPDVDDLALVEGDDDMENARRKSEFYFKRTGIPTISTDHFLWIEKWPHNNGVIQHIRKLANPKSPRATDEEVIAWYQKFLASVGGSSKTRFDYAIAYTDANGTTVYRSEGVESLLQTERASYFPEGYATEALLKDPKTGEFRVDQAKDRQHQSIATFLRTKVLARIIGAHAVTVFTTRPDTLFGATYLVLAPEHELVELITTPEQKKTVEKYKREIASKSDLERTALEKEKTGVFTGAYAVNPVNNEKIPVWIADYVLMSYGTGAIMAVPAHDERDYQFATKYKLPVEIVIVPTQQTRVIESSGSKVVTKSFAIEKLDDAGGIDAHIRYLKEEVGLAFEGYGLLVNSGRFTGLYSVDAQKKIVQWLETEGKAKSTVQYKLRDWVFSRQRYWGEPIPLVKCESCKLKVERTKWVLNFYEKPWHALQTGEKTVETRALNPDEPDRYFGDVKEGDVIKCVLKDTTEVMYLRVVKCHAVKNLEELHERKDLLSKLRRNFNPTLSELKEFYALTPDYVDRIQKNGLVAWEIEHVIPGVVPWEELPLKLPDVEKYEPTGTGESPLAAIDEWVNVKCPHCGGPAKRETNTMPQWAGSCWYYIRFCDPHNDEAMASPEAMKAWLPVDLYVGGAEHAVLHLLYARFWHMVLYDTGVIPKECGDEPFMKLKNQGLILGEDGEKMSKSRGNVINPDPLIKKFGADSFRMYEMFMGPFEDAKPWSTNGIIGVRRFLERVYKLVSSLAVSKLADKQSSRHIHRTIQKITEGITNFKFNTAVSDLMIFFDGVDGKPDWRPKLNSKGEFEGTTYDRGAMEKFLKLLSPFAPHIAEELWSRLGHKTLLAQEKWPEFDPKKVKEETVTIAVQVNGKHRGNVIAPSGSNESVVREAAEQEPNVKKYLTAKPKRVIFVKDRLLNYVV